MTRLVFTIAAISLASFMALTFIHNLPYWCANPSGNGNWMVVPLCTK